MNNSKITCDACGKELEDRYITSRHGTTCRECYDKLHEASIWHFFNMEN